MAAPEAFEVGEPCFAKVKGYPMWPAEVTSLLGSRFEVFFFGTHEVAKVGPKDILKATPANIEKFSQSGHVNRKFYKEGLEEMREFSDKASSKIKKLSIPVNEMKQENSKPTKRLKLETPSKVPLMTTNESTVSKIEKSPKRKSVAKDNESGEIVIQSPPKKVGSRDKLESTSPKRAVSKPVRFKVDDEPPKESTLPSTHNLPRKSPNKRRMHAQATSTNESKVPSSEKGSNVKININLSLEMDADTFVKVAKELPQLLSLAEVHKKSN